VDHCPRCGAAVALTMPQCPHCGLSRQSSGYGQAAAQQPHWQPPPERPARVWPVAALTVAVLVVLALIAAGALWATGTGPFSPDAQSEDVGSPPGATAAATTSTPSSSAAPTTPPGADSDDFSSVYSDVQSGVGLVVVGTCSGQFSGTGFMVGPTTLVTAAHVVEGASDVQVSFDDTPVEAAVTGIDSSLDLAVLTVPAQRSRHVFDLAQRDPNPGNRVAVIGYPFDEPKSLTEGTISGLDRTITTEGGTFTGLIQTDAAINPGNSGGPLVNSKGEVVGVADAIRRHAQGIGFAVPISQARAAVESGAGLTRPDPPSCSQPQAPRDSVTSGVTSTLRAYVAAINDRDYDTAMSLVSDSIRSQNPEEGWLSSYATTTDDELQVRSVSGSQTTAHVWATFRSRQAPGYGPSGAEQATCLLWSIDYTLTLEDSTWIISSVSGHTDPPWAPCS
jgi:serine protease Do